ncbi:Diels-Alderase ccsF [Madurella fahalii]|uniref:Diels-Alderase ccsF n=1 Tax=Madurella fahalii TaxID=1157608 RepID=A0ABQ0GKE7_9PEZI
MAPTANCISTLHFPAAITDDPVALEPYVAREANTFTKLPSKVGKTTWEVWYFDALSPTGDAAVTISFWRDATSKDGFRAQVHALFPDGTTFGAENPLPESTVQSAPSAGGGSTGVVTGIWRCPATTDGVDPEREAQFEIADDGSSARVAFKLASVHGTINLTAWEGAPHPGSQASGQFTPHVYLVRAIPAASAVADLSFSDGRVLRFAGGYGAQQRTWADLPWPVLMDLSYYLAAQVGPYTIRVMHITSRLDRAMPYRASALLLKDGSPVLEISGAEVVSTTQPCMILRPMFDGGSAGKDAVKSGEVVRGGFADANTGFLLDFVDPQGARHWQFEIQHQRPWWNFPTGPPQFGTGNSGFLERVVGGQVETAEVYEGHGLGGQCTVP